MINDSASPVSLNIDDVFKPYTRAWYRTSSFLLMGLGIVGCVSAQAYMLRAFPTLETDLFGFSSLITGSLLLLFIQTVRVRGKVEEAVANDEECPQMQVPGKLLSTLAKSEAYMLSSLPVLYLLIFCVHIALLVVLLRLLPRG